MAKLALRYFLSRPLISSKLNYSKLSFEFIAKRVKSVILMHRVDFLRVRREINLDIFDIDGVFVFKNYY